MTKSLPFTFLVFIGCVNFLIAQSHQLQLLNESDSLPIVGAHMVHMQDGNGFISNEEGKLFKPFKGLWRISHLGFNHKVYNSDQESDTLYLTPVFTVLEEVELYAFDLMGYLNSWLIDSEQLASTRTLLFRKLSRTNGELSHLFQAQLVDQPRKGLFLKNVQYASPFRLDSPLSHGGYVAPMDLMHMIHLDYPIQFLLRYMKGYTIEKLRSSNTYTKIEFSGIIIPDLKTEVKLRKGELLFCDKTKNLLSIAWELEWSEKGSTHFSERFRKSYTVRTSLSRMSWMFNLNEKLNRHLSSFEYVTHNTVDWGPIDEVSLTYQIKEEPFAQKSTRTKMKLDLHKPVLDQVKHVPISANNYLLTQEEYDFINSKH